MDDSKQNEDRQVTYSTVRAVEPIPDREGSWFHVTFSDGGGNLLKVGLSAWELDTFHRTARAVLHKTGRKFFLPQFTGNGGYKHWRDITWLLMQAPSPSEFRSPASPASLVLSTAGELIGSGEVMA